MNQLKGLWAVTALVVGVGMGFTAGTRTSESSSAGPMDCVRDSECDAGCGAVGAGACQFGHCYCRF